MRLQTKRMIDTYVGNALIALLKPFVVGLGIFLKRDHDPRPRERLMVIKLLGGGSLMIALPGLLGLRQARPDLQLELATTSEVVPFARLLGLFDRIHVIEDGQSLSFVKSLVRLLVLTSKTDTIVDLEVHSRLTTLISLLTRARNRIGFFKNDVFWLRGIATHLIYFNTFGPVYESYDAVSALLGSPIADFKRVRVHLLDRLAQGEPSTLPRPEGRYRVTIGFSCSANGQERMMSPSQWVEILRRRLREDPNLIGRLSLILLGGKADVATGEVLASTLRSVDPRLEVINRAGALKLDDSIREIRDADEFWGVDSALIHFARALGLRTRSYWGPTDPATRLRPRPEGFEEHVSYMKIPCSPCIHVVAEPPCRGVNVCMEALFSQARSGAWAWVADEGTSKAVFLSPTAMPEQKNERE